MFHRLDAARKRPSQAPRHRQTDPQEVRLPPPDKQERATPTVLEQAEVLSEVSIRFAKARPSLTGWPPRVATTGTRKELNMRGTDLGPGTPGQCLPPSSSGPRHLSK